MSLFYGNVEHITPGKVKFPSAVVLTLTTADRVYFTKRGTKT
jgi:hypothetical protein